MSFLNPSLLGLLGLVGIPLLIHLIRRRKLKVVQWAAMEFLLQSQKKQKRRLRIEEIILLLLRMIIVALAVLAFARPVLRAGIPLFSQNARVYAVIVLDNSYSMGDRGVDGRSSFERSQDSIHEMLTHVMKDGDSVSVVLGSSKPDGLVAVPSFDIKTVDRRIAALKPGDRATDYLATAQLVNRMLKASKSTIKEVYWFTDDQATAWETSNRDSAHAVWQDLAKESRVTWISTGAPAADRDNLAVDTPTLGRELVTPRLPASVESIIHNYGAHSKDALLVNLAIDGKPAASTRIAVPAGGSASAKFHPLITRPGTHTGVISLADPAHVDGLERDNSGTFAVRCRESIKVLLQDIQPARDPSKSESFYLLTAMAPGGAQESFAPKLREGPGFGNETLRDFDAVVIAGVSSLNAADRRVLTDYVKSGGGLLLFPGPDTDAAHVNADYSTASLLPAKLGQRRTLKDEDSITINPATIQHPALALFKDTSAIDIASARFLTYYPLSDDSDAASVRVMARFSNGDPAFVERKVGLGRVIIAASSAGGVWNQMPLKPSYVPLVYQLISYLGEGAVSRRNLKQDEPMFISLPLADANKSVRISDPSGQVSTVNSVLDARGVTVTYNNTARAGIYNIAVSGTNSTDAFSVGLDTTESNLAPADPAKAVSQAGVPADRLTIATSPAQLLSTVNRARYGVEIWRTFLWAIIPLLFIESLLAQVFGRRG
jgi:hypothetical protein